MIDVVSSSRVRCRKIDIADIDRLVDLITRSFSYVPNRDVWVQTFQRLSDHLTPRGSPRYGYFLECEDTLVGVILQIYSSILVNGEARIRCNVSGRYVESAFRCYASMLTLDGRRYKDVKLSSLRYRWKNGRPG